MKKSLITSIFLHALILFFSLQLSPLGNVGTSGSDGGKEGEGAFDKSMEVDIISPPKDLERDYEEIKTEENDDGLFALPEELKENQCNLYYGGIGVQQDFGGRLTEVFKGYPADKAGLQVGDVVEPVEAEDIRGEIGTPVRLRVIRGDSLFFLSIVREKICYEETR